MIRRSIYSLVVAVLALSLSGCAEEIRGDVELKPSTEFPVWLYSDIGPTGALFLYNGVHAMGFGGPFLGAAPGVEPISPAGFLAERVAPLPEGALVSRLLTSPACTPTLFGDGVDTDTDGIPDDRTATYTQANCTVFDTADGSAYIVRGTYRLRDTNDDRWGFRLDVTDLSIRIYDGTSTNEHQSALYNITETSNLTATAGTYHLIVDAVGSQGDFMAAGGRHLRYDITQTFTPAFTVPVGGPLPDGTMSLSGNIDVTIAEPAGAARVKLTLVTTTPIIYDDGCAGPVSGDHEMRLNGGTAEGIHVRYYSGCHWEYEPLGAGVL